MGASKQFTHTVWSHPDGRVLQLPHNPLHPVLPGAQEMAQRRIDRFIGFFARQRPAWVVEIVDAGHGVYGITCDNAYDEHLQSLLSEPDPDGFYCYDVRYRLREMDATVADGLVARSEFIEPFPDETHRAAQWLLPGFTRDIMMN